MRQFSQIRADSKGSSIPERNTKTFVNSSSTPSLKKKWTVWEFRICRWRNCACQWHRHRAKTKRLIFSGDKIWGLTLHLICSSLPSLSGTGPRLDIAGDELSCGVLTHSLSVTVFNNKKHIFLRFWQSTIGICRFLSQNGAKIISHDSGQTLLRDSVISEFPTVAV